MIFVAEAHNHINGASATSSLIINKPTGTVEGDLMVAVISLDDGTTATLPAGWTLISSSYEAACYKIAGASEGASYTWTRSGVHAWAGGIATYRGINRDTTYGAGLQGASNVYDSISGAGPAVFGTQSITRSGALVIAAVAVNGGGTIGAAPSGFTSRLSEASDSPAVALFDQFNVALGNETPGNVTLTGFVNWSTWNMWFNRAVSRQNVA